VPAALSVIVSTFVPVSIAALVLVVFVSSRKALKSAVTVLASESVKVSTLVDPSNAKEVFVVFVSAPFRLSETGQP
jgi:hypothetical protein